MRHPECFIGHFERLVEGRYVVINKALYDKEVQVSFAEIRSKD